jgi:hypothetical protein
MFRSTSCCVLFKQKTMNVLQFLQPEEVVGEVLDFSASENRFERLNHKLTVEATTVNKSTANLFPANLLNVLRRRSVQ